MEFVTTFYVNAVLKLVVHLVPLSVDIPLVVLIPRYYQRESVDFKATILKPTHLVRIVCQKSYLPDTKL